jgi:SAM-dependent methyltransferase
MNLIEKATVMHYHRHRIAEFDLGTARALGWRNQLSQDARFEVMATIGDLHGRSVLDVGCGHGDLKAYFDQLAQDYDYIGIDQMPEFIADARKRYAGYANAAFFQSDFSQQELPEVDYVIASGALGYRCAQPNFYFDMIAKFYAAARVGLGFNMLDVHTFPQHDLLIGHDRDAVLAFCQTLSPNVKLVTGYLDDDFTIFMYRAPL